jgi:hypothetical protein
LTDTGSRIQNAYLCGLDEIFGLKTSIISGKSLSFVGGFGSGMGKNQYPGSGIYIPDPPHCRKTTKFV